MPDCYMLFRERIPDITKEERRWIELTLVNLACLSEPGLEAGLNQELGELPEDPEEWPGFDWSLGAHDLLLHSNGNQSFCFDDVVLFVRAFIRKWRPDYEFRMTWAGAGAEHGGGWLYISKDRTDYDDVWAALNRVGRKVDVTVVCSCGEAGEDSCPIHGEVIEGVRDIVVEYLAQRDKVCDLGEGADIALCKVAELLCMDHPMKGEADGWCD